MFFIKEQEIKDFQLKITENDKLMRLWEALRARVETHTQHPGLEQSFDTNKWYHIVWERLGDAAFVYAVNKDIRLGNWIHDTVMDICRKTAVEWCGPWFREVKEPVLGSLETSHVGIAVALVYDLCKDLFDEAELEIIRSALRENCQLPCKRFVRSRQKTNNWFMVLLNGYAAASVALEDEAAIQDIIPLFAFASGFYNSDSYGESLQYSNYASLHLSHIYELLYRYNPSYAQKLDISCYTKLMQWYASSLVCLKESQNWEEGIFPRALNFGDSAVLFRPSADLLLHIAVRGRTDFPTEAGLARWLFETTYADEYLPPHDRATFGFFNSFGYLTLLLYSDAAIALSPAEAKLPLLSSFETGTVVMRDSWENAKTILGIQGGYKPNNATAHRHFDQNSFILVHQNERIFADPGHCCYRLASQAYSMKAESHNTWTFEDEAGNLYTQLQVSGGVAKGIQPSMNTLLIAENIDGLTIISSDAAKVYGNNFLQAERTWISASPNELFIIDRIQTKEPVRRTTHFVVNNYDGSARINDFPDGRIVIRRGDVGVKLIPAYTAKGSAKKADLFRFGWTYMHLNYHPQPFQKGQGAEGSGLIYRYSSPDYCREHINIYAIAMTDRERIPKWHVKMKEDSASYFIEPPGGEGGSTVHVDDNGIFITNCYNNQSYVYNKGKIVRTNKSE